MQGKEITLNELLESKTYIGENSMINFGSPKSYVEPFLEKFGNIPGVTFDVNVSERIANKETDSEKVNEAFGRVAIVAKMPEAYTAVSHDTHIGMVYALDIAKPTIRVYSGQNAWACTNLAIFGAKFVHTVDLVQNGPSVYGKTLEYINGAAEQLAKFQQIYERMNDKIYENEEINKIVGYLLRESNRDKGIGTTPVLSAVKDLDNPKSKYAIREGKTTQWNIYSSLTDYLTQKVDALERPMKTQLIGNLFVTSN